MISLLIDSAFQGTRQHNLQLYINMREGSIQNKIDKVLIYERNKWFCFSVNVVEENQLLLSIISTTSDTNWIENGDIYLKQKSKNPWVE